MKKKISIDRILFIMLFITLSVVTLSQIGLVIDETRDVFTDVGDLEGTEVPDDGIVKGTLTLTMADGTPGNNFEILVNGEKVDVFDNRTKEIVMLETSVVEVHAFDLEMPVSVTVDKISSNLTDTTKIKEIRIENGYNMIGRYVLN